MSSPACLMEFISNAEEVTSPDRLPEDGKNIRLQLGRGATVPGRSENPEFVNKFLDDIQNVSPTEKISMIDQFVDSRVKFVEQETGSPEDTRSLKGIFEAGEGDCDDYAYAKAVLLQQAGFSEVYTAGVKARYHFEKGSSGIESHTLTIVKNPEDGKDYVLDNLASEPYTLKERCFSSEERNIILPDNATDGPASMEVLDVVGLTRFTPQGQTQFFTDKPENDRSFIQPQSVPLIEQRSAP